MKNFLKNISLMFCSVLICGLLIEFFLRIFFPQPIDYFYFEKDPKPNTKFKRWNLEVAINNSGYRDINHEQTKSENTYRIAFIGDSITYGTGVRFEDIYHQKLKKMLQEKFKGKKIEILAFNQGATNTKWANETYVKTACQYKPDMVILGFCLNDIENYESSSLKNTKRSIYDLLAYIHEHARINSHLYFLIFERSRRFVYQHFLDRKVRTADSWMVVTPNSNEYSENFKRSIFTTVKQLEEFRENVERDKAHFLVVIFPFEMQLSKRYADLYAKEYKIRGLDDALSGLPQKILIQELIKRNLKYIDLLPKFQEKANQNPDQTLFFRELGGMLDWAHPNADGHELAAKIIFDYFSILPYWE